MIKKIVPFPHNLRYESYFFCLFLKGDVCTSQFSLNGNIAVTYAVVLVSYFYAIIVKLLGMAVMQAFLSSFSCDSNVI